MKKIINVLYIWKILGPTLSVDRPLFWAALFFPLKSADVSGAGTLDDPLRTSSWEAKNAYVRRVFNGTDCFSDNPHVSSGWYLQAMGKKFIDCFHSRGQHLCKFVEQKFA